MPHIRCIVHRCDNPTNRLAIRMCGEKFKVATAVTAEWITRRIEQSDEIRPHRRNVEGLSRIRYEPGFERRSSITFPDLYHTLSAFINASSPTRRANCMSASLLASRDTAGNENSIN